MKARKYKFDALWLQAIALADMSESDSKTTESLIRDYIETGEDPTEYFRGTIFECAWILIKSQIDLRKLRNARARERRLIRKSQSTSSKNSETSSVNTQHALSANHSPYSHTPSSTYSAAAAMPADHHATTTPDSHTIAGSQHQASPLRECLKTKVNLGLSDF